MDITGMKTEEIQAYINQLETAATQRETEITNLTAERDSLKDENEKAKTDNQKLTSDLMDAKKLNFTLARSAGKGEEKKTEDILYSMFFDKSKGGR